MTYGVLGMCIIPFHNLTYLYNTNQNGYSQGLGQFNSQGFNICFIFKESLSTPIFT